MPHPGRLRTDKKLASGSWQGGQKTLGNRARKGKPGLGGRDEITVRAAARSATPERSARVLQETVGKRAL